MQQTDTKGRTIPDQEDRPNKLTKAAKATVDAILGEDDPYNYIRAKAIVQIGKTELVKKNKEKVEELMLEAQTQITNVFGEEHPLTAKYNHFLIEAYNMQDSTPARTAKIIAICQKNLEITSKHYGEGSLFSVRVLYTMYTAYLHEET